MEKLGLNVKEAAHALGVSVSSIYSMVYCGELPHRRVRARGHKGAGKILISRKALEAWLESR